MRTVAICWTAFLVAAKPWSSAFIPNRLFGVTPRNGNSIITFKSEASRQLGRRTRAISEDTSESFETIDKLCDVEPKKTFLLDRIGGEAALKAAVEELYARLIVDEKLAKYFEGVAMEKLKMHQYNFMELAFTAIPEECDIVDLLTTAHGRLWNMGLDETDFDRVAGHFVATLEFLGLGQEEIDEAVGVIAPLRGIFQDNHKEKSS